ncbi:MAG TPA: histidine kinase [Nocardioides sp.]|uniref:sensor histidine kinase n=1 Tax=Nocardioides sp. TaxID=35761 RepID=UPI002F419BC2
MTSRLGLPPGRALLLDAGLVSVFVALLLNKEFLGIGTPTDIVGKTWWTFPLFLLGDLALLVRRRRPEVAAIGFYATYALHALVTSAGVEGAFELFPALTALYSLGAYAERQRLAIGVLGVVGLSALHDTRDPALSLSDDTEVWSYLMWTCVLLLFLVGGVLVRTARQGREQRGAAEEAERARAEAVASERAKIARELHDVVTHNVNVVVMQAMAASGVLESDPSRVRAPLEAIESSGREALAEMRRMLGVLREEDELLLAPQPGVSDITRLAETLQHAGQPVSCHIDESVVDLPDGMGMVLFRIAQEALTNAMKHARGAALSIVVRRTSTTVELEGLNGAGTPEDEPTGARHGLIGMRERAALFGGRVDARPTGDGGFHVVATLPLAPA